MKRRNFLKLALSTPLLTVPKLVLSAIPKKKVLFLGGRGFFGPVAVQALKDAGHEVVLTNRGITNPHLFPELRWVYCDRETHDRSGLKQLVELVKREKFDWVVDTWQKHPAAVMDTARLFKDKIPIYQYVSTFSSYLEWDSIGIDETYPLNDVAGLSYSWSEEYRYALRKTMGELAVMKHYPQKHAIFRSHGMRGVPSDPNDMPYWPVRIMRGGDVLVPGDGNHFVQVTDMISLSNFMIHCGEQQITGDYSVAYPPTKFLDYIAAVMEVTGTSPTYHWMPQKALEEYGIQPYRELAFWRPNRAGAYRFNVSKALKAGLKNRSFQTLIADQLANYRLQYPNDNFRFGEGDSDALSAEREKAILADWLSHQAAISG